MSGKECSAYRSGGGPCSNGFIQRAACWGGVTSERYLPYCLYDELPDHWVDERGYPKFIPKEAKSP